MSTYREVAYMVLDGVKMSSDDSHFRLEHVLFLLDKFRTALLEQRYKDIKREIAESNYQTICLHLEVVEGFENDACGGLYLRSVEEIPDIVPISIPKVSSVDFFKGMLSFTNNERFKYIGRNKFLKNNIYTTIAPNKHLYLKAGNIQHFHLEQVRLRAVFEDSAGASELGCDDAECELLDRKFPLEEALISTLIDMVTKQLSGLTMQPKDRANNAADDTGDLANYVNNALKQKYMRDQVVE